MSSTDVLEQDSNFHTPLERVNYAAGMLLGVEATRDEQAYHRRRLNRERYWFRGAGTLLGLGVSVQAEAIADIEADTRVDLLVSPGVGIDGLGREVMSHEPYCLNLREWFRSQLESPEGNLLIQDGLEASGDRLSLLITMRYRDCEAGLQPVLARKVNAGTDPVEPSRARDGLILEIIPGPVPERDDSWFWGGHVAAEDFASSLTDAERDYLDSLAPEARQLLEAQGERVYALPNTNRALEVSGDPEEVARTVLAQVRVPLRTSELPALSPIVNPNRIEVNNLVRRFIQTAEQNAWLARQP